MKAISIIRVSSKEQEEGFSQPAQEKKINEYCQRKGLEVERHFVFWESAKLSSNRKKFNGAIRFAQENRIKHIIVEKTDRFTRNFADLNRLEEMIKNEGLSLHLIDENEIINSKSNSHAKMMFGFKVLMAKHYVDELGEKVRKGKNEKASQGLYPQKAPFGYRNAGERQGIVVVPEQAPYIRKMFELYCTGEYSFRKIAEWLNTQGIKPNRGIKWHKEPVRRIITNPVYYGDFMWADTLYKGIHEPIIKYETFKKAQAIFKRRTKATPCRGQYPFTGMIYNYQNRLYAGSTKQIKIKGGQKKPVVYYESHTREKRLSISEPKLVELLNAAVLDIQWTEETAQVLKDAVWKIYREEKKNFKKNAQAAERKISLIERKKRTLLKMALDEEIDRPTFVDMRSELDAQITELEREMSGSRQTEKEFEQRVEELVFMMLELPSLFVKASPKQKAHLLGEIAEKVTLTKDKKIRLKYTNQIAAFAGNEKVRNLARSRDGRDSNPRPPA